jgi:hypothetical protein
LVILDIFKETGGNEPADLLRRPGTRMTLDSRAGDFPRCATWKRSEEKSVGTESSGFHGSRAGHAGNRR